MNAYTKVTPQNANTAVLLYIFLLVYIISF